MSPDIEAPRFRTPDFSLDLMHEHLLSDTDLLRTGNLVYIWLDDGDNFWFMPTRIHGQLVSGFREMFSEWVFLSFLKSEVKGFA